MSKLEQSSNNDEFEKSINQALDDSIDNLSPEVRRSLNQIRVNATEKKSTRFFLVPLASAFVLIFAVLIGSQQGTEKVIIEETPFAEVLQEDLELIDDLEFIYWINEESESANL